MEVPSYTSTSRGNHFAPFSISSHLRRQVVGSSYHCVCKRSTRPQQLRDPQVPNLDEIARARLRIRVRRKENIGSLHIPVKHLLGVNVIEAEHHLKHQRPAAVRLQVRVILGVGGE